MNISNEKMLRKEFDEVIIGIMMDKTQKNLKIKSYQKIFITEIMRLVII